MSKQTIMAEVKEAQAKAKDAALALKAKDEMAYNRVIRTIDDTVADMEMVEEFDFKFFGIDSAKKFLSVYYTMLARKHSAKDSFDKGVWGVLDKMLQEVSK